jgi:hypothetical protein
MTARVVLTRTPAPKTGGNDPAGCTLSLQVAALTWQTALAALLLVAHSLLLLLLQPCCLLSAKLSHTCFKLVQICLMCLQVGRVCKQVQQPNSIT